METTQHTDSARNEPHDDEVATRMRALFRTMADFHRAAPWRCAELANHVIAVTIPDLGVREAAVMLLGDDLPGGFFVFACIEDVDLLSRETDAHRRKQPAICPSVVVLTFEPPPNQAHRDRVDQDGLELAAPDAFPLVARLATDFRRDVAEPLDVLVASTIAAAMTAFVQEFDPAAWERGEPVLRTVRIHLGEIAISLRNADVPSPPPPDILAGLAELERVTPLDPFRRIALEEELMRQFADACNLGGMPAWLESVPRVVFDAAVRDHGVTIASLDESALRTILFDTLPELDVIDASQAHTFVAALVAFFHFMKIGHALPQADALLRVVGEGAAERLESRIRAVKPGWVPNLPHPVDLAPPSERTDRAARRAKRPR